MLGLVVLLALADEKGVEWTVSSPVVLIRHCFLSIQEVSEATLQARAVGTNSTYVASIACADIPSNSSKQPHSWSKLVAWCHLPKRRIGCSAILTMLRLNVVQMPYINQLTAKFRRMSLDDIRNCRCLNTGKPKIE